MKINNGIVYTDDNCIGCNKCISVCPILGANVAETRVNGNIIYVDQNKCIRCGACLSACEHNARKYRDDTEQFLNDLAIEDSNISVLISDSFALHYPDKYKKVLGCLKAKGAKHVYNIDFAGQIALWATQEYYKDQTQKGLILQHCPVVVNYITKHKPELITKLNPIQSPTVCGAIYLRKYKGVNEKFAFIGTCIAKKDEFEDESTNEIISYNITYKNLMKELEKYDLSQYEDTESEVVLPGAMAYLLPGGVGDLFKTISDEEKYVRSINGSSSAFNYLDGVKQAILDRKELPDVIEIDNCLFGCEYGYGSNLVNQRNNEEILMKLNKIKYLLERNKNTIYYKGNKPEKNKKELRYNFRNLDLKDFVRNYSTNKFVYEKLVSNEEVERIFKDMGKETLHDKTINCGACGYHSCREMVNAIARGYNHRSNCLFSVKNELANEKKELTKVIEKMNDAKEEVERVNQAKSDFLAKMSHEIRTPINVIIGLTELLIDEETNGTLRDYALDIKNASGGLLSIINDILDLTKIESGKISIDNAEYEVETLLRDVVNIMRVPIEKKNLQFNVNVSHDISKVLYGDMARIRQILINVLNNACKFTSEGHIDLTVTSTKKDDFEILKFEIADTGCGIDKNDYDKLFSEFEQVDNSISRKQEGTGLGLPISKNLANLMDGDIVVESEVGKGSKFIITIMNKIAKDTTIETQQPYEVTKNFGFTVENAQVLVVDDNEINLRVITRILKKYGIDAKTAINGIEAVDLVKRNVYDLVFMDQMMPEMDGVEATQTIRNLEEEYYKNLPIVALTANAVVGTKEELLEAGMNDFISKPIDIKLLEKMLKKYLADKVVNDESRAEYDQSQISKQSEFEEKKDYSDGPAVDIITGIQRCAGSEDIYLDVIETFYESGKNLIKQAQEEFEKKEYVDYKITVHGIKSASANIGANKLSELAKEQEYGVKEERITDVENGHAALISEFQKVLNLLSPYAFGKKLFYDAAGKMTIDRSDLLSSIRSCHNSLDNSDVLQCVNELDKILKFSYIDVRVLDIIHEARNILAFEFNVRKGKEKLEEAEKLLDAE